MIFRHSLCWTQYWSRFLQAHQSSSNSPNIESDTSHDRFKLIVEKPPQRSWCLQPYESLNMQMNTIWMIKVFDKSPSYGTLDDLSQIKTQLSKVYGLKIWSWKLSKQKRQRSYFIDFFFTRKKTRWKPNLQFPRLDRKSQKYLSYSRGWSHVVQPIGNEIFKKGRFWSISISNEFLYA